MSNNLMAIVQQRFSQQRELIRQNTTNISVLKEKSERSGETDGFRQYEFSDLPFAVDGMTEVRFAFVVDGVDVGESAGMGTGCLCVYKPSVDEWRLVATNVAVTV